MKIKSILVSQPAPVVAEKSPFHELAVKYGIDFKFYPFIKLEGVSLKEFRSQRIELLGHTAVIFTSRTTIDNYFRICEESRVTIPETMKYFCNTEAVALYLQKYIVYRKRKIFFADGSFANFMELILKHKEEKFLLTLSEPHKPEMPLAMEKLKLNFSKAILARTVSNDLSGVDVSAYDMMVFYSPSEIHALTQNFPGINGRPRIATFGHGTTKTAIDDGLSISVMAPTPEVPSMTKALDIYIKKVNSGAKVDCVTLEGESPDLAFIQAQELKAGKRRAATKTAAKTTAEKTSAPKSGKVAAKNVKPAKPAAKSVAKTPAQTPSGTSLSVVMPKEGAAE